MGKGSALDVKGYVNYLKKDFCHLITALGAILIAVAPFVPWAFYYINENGTKDSDFGSLIFMPKFALIDFVGDKKGVTIMSILGVIMLLSGIILILWHVAPFSIVVSNIKHKFNISCLPYILLGVVTVCIVLAMMNGELKESIEAAREIMEEYSQVLKGSATYSVGPYVASIGVVMSLIGNILSGRRG
ncbi:MAG: hypothetical protein E7259_07970 [Lachnospiraceae bacterium]|nr:hypothetical protein [Lachnospiraceae bacterium]